MLLMLPNAFVLMLPNAFVLMLPNAFVLMLPNAFFLCCQMILLCMCLCVSKQIIGSIKTKAYIDAAIHFFMLTNFIILL